MNVVILSNSSFPWGMAATTRVRCLAKGMMAEGISVDVIGFHGADVPYSVDKHRTGCSCGVKYSYPGGFTVRPSSWLLRRIDDASSTCAILLELVLRKLRRRLDIVVLYSRNHRTVLFWSSVVHFLNTPVVLELCEWPLANAQTKNHDLRNARAFCHDAVLSADAILPISSYIEQQATQIATASGRSFPSFKIPILIDADPNPPSAGSEISDKPTEPYLLYIGAISYFDIATLIVDISASLKEQGVEVPIKFTGGGSQAAFDALRAYARANDVLDNLEFTGFVSDDVLTRLMRGATALLAPLPHNPQSMARFPTKLGFYLASGRPVVTTDVGDVTQYLRDGVSALIAPSCDPATIAERIRALLNDPGLAETIGNHGREVAFGQFHFSRATRGIRRFFEAVVRTRHRRSNSATK